MNLDYLACDIFYHALKCKKCQKHYLRIIEHNKKMITRSIVILKREAARL